MHAETHQVLAAGSHTGVDHRPTPAAANPRLVPNTGPGSRRTRPVALLDMADEVGDHVRLQHGRLTAVGYATPNFTEIIFLLPNGDLEPDPNSPEMDRAWATYNAPGDESLFYVGHLVHPLDDGVVGHGLECLVVDATIPPAPVRRPAVMGVPVEVDVPAMETLPLQEGIVTQNDLATVAADDGPHDVDAGPVEFGADLVAIVVAPDQVDRSVELSEDFLRPLQRDVLAGKIS